MCTGPKTIRCNWRKFTKINFFLKKARDLETEKPLWSLPETGVFFWSQRIRTLSIRICRSQLETENLNGLHWRPTAVVSIRDRTVLVSIGDQIVWSLSETGQVGL